MSSTVPEGPVQGEEKQSRIQDLDLEFNSKSQCPYQQTTRNPRPERRRKSHKVDMQWLAWPMTFLGHTHKEVVEALAICLWKQQGEVCRAVLYTEAQQSRGDCRCQHSPSQTYACGFLHYLSTARSSFPMTCSHFSLKVIASPK